MTGEPPLPFEHLRFDGAVVAGLGGRFRLCEPTRFGERQRPRHQVDARAGHLHLVAELDAQLEGTVRDPDGVLRAARQRERGADGERRLHDDAAGVLRLVDQRLAQRERFVHVRREQRMDGALGGQLGAQVRVLDRALGRDR